MNDHRTSVLEEPASRHARYGTNPPRRILLVDDDICTRRSSTYALLLSGYQVDATEDGETGWEALNDHSYDLLIAGNNLPKVSGIDLLKKLHAARITMPVILASETLPREELTCYPWLQFAATLPKLFTDDELLKKVKCVLHAADGARAQIETMPI